jgi:hypothetical protein
VPVGRRRSSRPGHRGLSHGASLARVRRRPSRAASRRTAARAPRGAGPGGNVPARAVVVTGRRMVDGVQ